MKIRDVDIKRKEHTYDQLVKDGHEDLAAGRTEVAAEKYTAALKEQPSNVVALNCRAQAYLNLERFEDAENDANLVLELDPENMKALLRRGWARLSLKIPNVEGGRADLSRVMSIEPGNKKARALLESRSRTALEGGASAAVMIVEDDSDGGCSWCPVVTEASPEDEQASVSFWEKGEQLRKAKDWAEAVDFYNRGVVANPRNAVCWRSISEVRDELGDSKASQEAARRAVHIAD